MSVLERVQDRESLRKKESMSWNCRRVVIERVMMNWKEIRPPERKLRTHNVWSFSSDFLCRITDRYVLLSLKLTTWLIFLLFGITVSYRLDSAFSLGQTQSISGMSEKGWKSGQEIPSWKQKLSKEKNARVRARVFTKTLNIFFLPATLKSCTISCLSEYDLEEPHILIYRFLLLLL